MIAAGALTAGSVRVSPSRRWGGFGDAPALVTTKSVRLTVNFLHGDRATASLAVWACVVPDAAIGHAVLLGRDSWMRVNSRTFTTLPRPGPDGRVMGELTLSPRFTAGACVYATHDDATASSLHLK